VFHQEIHGITTFTAGKALTNLTGWRHHKRRSLIVVEGAQTLVVNPRLAQVNKLAHHIHDVHGIHNFIDSRSVYHRSDKDTHISRNNKKITAQIARFVHKRADFVHFIWLCAQKVVPLQRFLRKGYHFYTLL
jgi:hypothetical protein